MNTSAITLPASAANTKPLWAAVSVLGVAVVALGASLVYVQSRPVDGHAALSAINSTPALVAPFAAVAAPESLNNGEDLVAPPAKPPVVVAKPPPARTVAKLAQAPAAPAPVAVAGPAPAPAATPAPVTVVASSTGSGPGAGTPSVITDTGTIVSRPVPVAQQPLCANCGTIESVTTIQRNGKSGSGVGVVAGGALGAVLGNQVGKGGGRTLATILGAVGGGLAGNAIEKNIKKETAYQVHVRMEDGSVRTVEQTAPATIGTKVTVDAGVLHSAGQRAWEPTPVFARPVTPPQGPQGNGGA